MAEDAATGKVASPKAADVSVAGKAKAQKRKGLLSRMWAWTFGGRRQDYESLLQHLSKEEADVHRRMKRRQQWWSSWARNIIVCAFACEILAVAYAFVITRTEDLSWQKRALHVSPMFFLPALSFGLYTLLSSYTKMRERKDQRTLERLRAERQAKIDELKEKSNYYITQQLIQKYDLDPAAKAAAATVLATKLGAESGLKVRVGDEQRLQEPLARSSDVELVPPTDGLRNRKQPGVRSQGTRTKTGHQLSPEEAGEIISELDAAAGQGQLYVEHYKGSTPNEGGWVARLAAMLVGEDPTQCYALICGNCHMHNGLSRKEDFPYVTYYCPHCRALNGPRHAEGNVPGSDSVSGPALSSPPAPGSADITPKVSTTAATVTEAVEGTSLEIQDQPPPSSGESNEVPPSVQN